MHRALAVIVLLAGCAATPGGVDDHTDPWDGSSADAAGVTANATAPGSDATTPGNATSPGNATADSNGAGNATAPGNATANANATANGTSPPDGGEPTGSGEPTGGSGEPTGSSGEPTGSGGEPTGSGGEPTGGSDPPPTRPLEVSLFDYAGTLHRPRGAYVEVAATRWEPDLSYGSAGPHGMGDFTVDELHEDGLTVRPDGDAGAVCRTDFAVKDEPDPTLDGVVQIEIYDAEVWIYGQAIPGHGNWETALKCPR